MSLNLIKFMRTTSSTDEDADTVTPTLKPPKNMHCESKTLRQIFPGSRDLPIGSQLTNGAL
jgi:hypothetical protein